jgi:hypothetical protein
MSNFSPNNDSNDRRETRRQCIADRNIAGANPWIIGSILIVLGGVFLMDNLGWSFFHFTNWWALFILIPVIGAAQRAFHLFQKAENQLTPQVIGSIFIAVFFTLLMLSLMFSIRLTIVGPILFIFAGLGILIYEMMIKKA